MKTTINILTNWRYYVMAALATIACLSILAAFGDFDNGITLFQWLASFIALIALGAASGYALIHLINIWDAAGLIPEWHSFTKDAEKEWN